VLDLLEAADKTGAALLTLTGASWPADAPEVHAGDVLSVSAADAHWGSIPPGDLAQLREVGQRFYYPHGATVAYPPTVLPSDGADSKRGYSGADDGQLVAKVSSLAVALGNAWEDAMYVALKLNQEYGNGRDLRGGKTSKPDGPIRPR
jgi:hypothetical protein